MTAPPRRILIVDDEAHILQVLTLKLRNNGYDVLTAGDGEEAFDLAVRETPDLIITDYQMPYMTGLELCQALAKEERTQGIPVLMLTARGYALDDADLLIGNIRAVLTKPFSPRSIVARVGEVLAHDSGDESESVKNSNLIPRPAHPLGRSRSEGREAA